MADPNRRPDPRLLCDPHTLVRSEHATITARRREDNRPVLAHIIVVSCLADGLMVRAADSAGSRASWGIPWASIVDCRRGHAPAGAVAHHLGVGREVLTPLAPDHAHDGRPGRVRASNGPLACVLLGDGEVEWHDIRALRPFMDTAGAPDEPAPAPAVAPGRARRRVPPGWTFADAYRRLGPHAR